MGYRPGNTARLQGSDRRLLSVGPGYTAVLEHSPCLTLHPHNPPRTAPGQGSRTSKWTCPGFQAACPKEPEAPVTSCSKAHKVPIRVMSSHKIRPSGKPACVPAFMTALPAWCANPGHFHHKHYLLAQHLDQISRLTFSISQSGDAVSSRNSGERCECVFEREAHKWGGCAPRVGGQLTFSAGLHQAVPLPTAVTQQGEGGFTVAHHVAWGAHVQQLIPHLQARAALQDGVWERRRVSTRLL